MDLSDGLPWAHIGLLLVLALVALGLLEVVARILVGALLAGVVILVTRLWVDGVSWNVPWLMVGCASLLILAPELLPRLFKHFGLYLGLGLLVGLPTYLFSAYVLHAPAWLAIADAVVLVHLGFSAGYARFVMEQPLLRLYRSDSPNRYSTDSPGADTSAYVSDSPGGSASSPVSAP